MDKLREIDIKIGQGKDVLSACREASATDKSYYRWMDQFLNAGYNYDCVWSEIS